MILFIVGFLLFGVRLVGDPTPLMIGTVVFMLTTVQLGLIIGIFTTTQSAAVQAIGTIKVLTAFLLAGFLFPPQQRAVSILDRVLSGSCALLH